MKKHVRHYMEYILIDSKNITTFLIRRLQLLLINLKLIFGKKKKVDFQQLGKYK